MFGLGAIAGASSFFALITDNTEVTSILGGIGFVFLVIYAFQNSRTYICERCGKKFK